MHRMVSLLCFFLSLDPSTGRFLRSEREPPQRPEESHRNRTKKNPRGVPGQVPQPSEKPPLIPEGEATRSARRRSQHNLTPAPSSFS